MRKIVLLLAMALLVSSLTAQTVEELKTLNQTVSKNGIISQQSPGDVKSTKKTDEETWVKDSTYYYTANGDEWELDEKSVIELRDEYGNPVVEKTYFYDAEKDLWEPMDSIHMKWHAFEVQAEEVTYAWNSSEQIWSDTLVHEEYNENGKKLSRISRSWDSERNTFKNKTYYYSYIYDSSNFLIEYTLKDESAYGTSGSKRNITNDENGNKVGSLVSNFEKGAWVPSAEEKFIYDENSLLSVEEYYCLDDANNSYKCREIVYEYDENGNETLRTDMFYNIEDSTLINSSQAVKSYDSNNNLTQYSYKYWEGESWKVSHEANYSYNENHLLDSTTGSWFNDYTETFEKYSSTKYFWSPFTNENISIQEPQGISICLSPNPVQSIMHINANDAINTNISIYSVSGKLVKELDAKGQSTIDLGSLHSGIYFIRVDTQQGSVVQKIMKQ